MRGARAFVLTAVCMLWSAHADATWLRRYEKLPSDTASAVAALPDGGAVLLARGFVHALIRIDQRGEVVVARRLESAPSFVVSGERGEVLIGSNSSSEGFKGAPWIARLDGDLSLRWGCRLMTSTPFPDFQILGAAVTRDGGALLSGKEGSAAFVLKLGSTGDLEWSRTIDPSDEEEISAIQETRDGGVVGAGRSRRGPWIVKLDRAGNVSWHRTYPADGRFNDVLETEDGGVLAVGRYRAKALAVKTGGDGEARWQTIVDGLVEAWGIGSLSRGRVVLSGSDGAKATVLLEIAADGAAGWRKRIAHDRIARQVSLAGRLATTASAIYLTPASRDLGLDARVYALRIDPGTSDACWLGDAGDVKVIRAPVPASEFSFDVRQLSVRIERVDGLSLTSLALTSSEEACAVVNQPRVTSAARVSAFRGRVQDLERKERYRALLVAKEYDVLDELAEKFRREKTRHDPMWWEIVRLYDAIVGDETLSEGHRLERLRAWSDARPTSTTARIALALELQNAAWTRRGAGYADTVTPKGWAEYEKLLKESMALIGSVEKWAQSDPRYWSLLVSFARQTGEGDVREIIRRAAAAGQHEPKLFQEAAFYLHPRWGGSGAQYRAFAEEAAALTRATFGEGMYAWLAYQAMFATEEREYAEEYAFDWPRMKRGFEDIIRLNPLWLPSHHRYAFTADRFEDRKAARTLFQRPDLDWYEGAELMWRERKTYDRAREWALRTPVEPFIESGPANIKASSWKPISVRARAGDMHWPPIVMAGERTAGDTVHRHVGFLVKSGDAVKVVTSFAVEGGLEDRDSAIRTMSQRTARWSMWAPAAPYTKVLVTGIETVDPPNRQLGVAVTLDLPESISSLHVLKQPSNARDVSASRRLYVVGCRWIESRCEQIVAEGALFGEGRSGSLRRFSVALFDTFDAESFVGAPVLDEDGWVVGVSAGPDGSSAAHVSQILLVDFLMAVMPQGPPLRID